MPFSTIKRCQHISAVRVSLFSTKYVHNFFFAISVEILFWPVSVIQHLNSIKKAAPDRVGIYGLVRQDETSRRCKKQVGILENILQWNCSNWYLSFSFDIPFSRISVMTIFAVKPIYVHSKLSIVDDEWILTGSTNMDNMSFFYSSELSITITNAELARSTKVRLMQVSQLTMVEEHQIDYFWSWLI